MSKSRTFLVTGATGQQGGATARQLLSRGVAVRALVRDRTKDAARSLKQLGAELIEGDLEQPDTLGPAVEGVDGVFLITSGGPHMTMDQEIRQGINLVAASKQAAVSHFVFTSFIGTFEPTGVSFLDSKRKIEQHLQESGLPVTVLRPGTFMENFQNMWFQGGRLYAAIKPTSALALISAKDIGAFAAIALTQPQDFIGKVINLAVDIRTPLEVAQTFSSVLGRKISFAEMPLEQVKQFNEGLARMFERMRDVPAADVAAQVDINWLRSINPDFWTLEQWAEQTLKP